jgi:hypothetical protein
MDIFRFINSKDIRNYLKEIDYKFSPLETAWLIYQCESATVEEKHGAWQEIIDTMPDCRIEWHSWSAPRESLNKFLKDYMRIENNLIKDYCRDDSGAVYLYSITIDDSNKYFNDPVICSTYDECISRIKQDLNVLTDEDGTINYITINKRHIDKPKDNSEMIINTDFKVLSIWQPIKNDNDDEIYNLSFDMLWFAFPTPFKKGDIVWNRYTRYRMDEGVFVLEETAVDMLNRRIQEGKKNGFCDSSDMIAYGYYQDDDGTIYSECMHNYMNLEYYPHSLNGKEKVLIALSNFQKAKIDISLFANAYHHILINEYAKECIPKEFTDEGLALAGIK